MINRELFQKPRYLLVDNKFYLLIILDNTKEYFCPFCGQIIKKGNGWHIRKCIKNYVDNITEEEKARERKESVGRQTVEIADKVVDKQMRIVQEIASLLGETAAETKIALTKLKETIADE